ncbi:lytic transglycosylase domain-containing protein [Streptomyces dubilierae]|uniref:Lytic transglycosylase domain-containing protein n=1 Tax=Streptomyces dubilierae TaxID=3075533 RepID=A0ABU2PCX5_9ACTN|nr:lytic transglycosylase domain-containing protein [Streptomyces sp. DSM 41921]MDT0389613.1 lytic transglycosylase domain-containing protein [Streptomyces sp. DSM 41921]
MAAQFGRRLRKGAATTAVAAVAVAALSASQAPGVNDHGRQTAADATPSPDVSASDGSATGNSPYYTDLPPLKSPNPSPSTGPSPSGQGETESGIPATVLDAYKKAEASLRESKPGCNLPWQLLAAIGRVESGQARGGRVDAEGTTIGKILGPQLDGNGFALIKDTDNGAYDGNSAYDQAVGPMQFIPSTWAWAGRDGNADGKKDPNNIYDAALAAGHYLCRNNWDLSDQDDLDRAILSYNNSREYLNLVMRWLDFYRKGTHEVPDGTGTLPGNRSDGGSGAGSDRSTPSSPAAPSTPGQGAGKPKPSPKPEKPGGGTPSPKPPTTPPGSPIPPPSTSPTPTDTVDHLENAGAAKLTAMAGDAFTQRISTRAETKAGKAVAKVRVRFTILGDTDTTFTGGESVATVATNSSGVAVAPALQAGEKTGAVTIRATVVGRTVPGLDYTATVTERAADKLARTGDAALTCVAGGEFADAVQVKATYQGAVADGVAATATLVKSAADTAANDKGPYFKDAAGKPVRTLAGLKTDAKGLLTLPKLYADDTAGTFLLRVTTAGGATLTVELTVTAAATSSPSPSADPSA